MQPALIDLGPMPEWRLSDLYQSPESPELARDLEHGASTARSLKAQCQGKLAGLAENDPAGLADAIRTYEQLQDAGKELYKRSITFTEPKIGKRKGGAVHTLRWIGRATYHKGEGWIELAWWHEVMPHLCGLQRQFTKYQLQQASALRSLYSWRLLELMQSWQDKGRFEISIEDFAKAMEATEKQRQDFAAIRRRMIEPAIKELEQKDGWLIQWEPVKLGRKVSSLRFAFMKNPQQSLL